MKFDVNPSVSMIASRLGVDPNTISVKANADGTYTVSMPMDATPQDSQILAIVTAMAPLAAATAPGAANNPLVQDIIDILSPT